MSNNIKIEISKYSTIKKEDAVGFFSIKASDIKVDT
jgi:hypothetical protein